MGFGCSRNSGIKYLRDYKAAVEWYDATKPIRGRTEDKRPLGHRRNVDSFWILKHDADEQGVGARVECYLYHTPVVTYHADGRIEVKCDRWATVATTAFINEVSPFSARKFDNSIVISHRVGMGEMHETRLPKKGSLFFKYHEQVNGMGVYELLNPQKEYDYRINRKAANNVRRRFKEFRDYLLGSVKLREFGAFSMQEYRDAKLADEGSRFVHNSVNISQNKEGKTHLLNMMLNPDSFYEASLWIAANVGHRMWFGDGEYRLGTEDVATKRFDGLLMQLHAIEVLEQQEMPQGEVKRNRFDGWLS